MEVIGKVKAMLAPETYKTRDGSEVSTSRILVTTDAKFKPDICFQISNEKAKENLKGLNVGDEINVSYNLNSREYNGKWYHNVNAWKIEKIGGEMDNDDVPF